MVELLGQFKPEEMAVEELFFSKNITTGIAVQCRTPQGIVFISGVSGEI